MSKRSEQIELQGNCYHSIEVFRSAHAVSYRCTKCDQSFRSLHLDFELKHKFGKEGFEAEKARLNKDKQILLNQIELERRSI